MDFEGLFWIALVVFYFIARALGGKKRSKRGPAPKRERTGSQQSRTARSAQRPDQELDEALREIRRALGFPVEAQEKDAPTSPPEPVVEGRRRPGAGGDLQREERRTGISERRTALEAERGRRAPAESGEQRLRDERELARQRELRERAAAASDRTGRGIPRPEVARKPGPRGIHALEPGFAEEERFERIGQHPHEERSAPEPWATDAARSEERRAALQERLRKRSSLQEAFVLKELLDKPVSLRKRRLS